MHLQKITLGGSASRSDALHKIHRWAPSKARSYTIKKIKRYEYGYFSVRCAWFRVTVSYHSKVGEGSYRLGDFDWYKYCLKQERFPVLRNEPEEVGTQRANP